MSTDYEMMIGLYEGLGADPSVFSDSDVAHLVIHANRVVGARSVPGFHAEPEELADGVRVRVSVDEGVVLRRQVHMCFGMLPERGSQRIVLQVRMEPGSKASLLAHCVFPNAVDVVHRMEAQIDVGEGASYRYLERHVHGPQGGVLVQPGARVRLAAGALIAGGAAVLMIVLQILTGLLLNLTYEPVPVQAWASVQYLQTDQFLGRLLRNMHHWTGHFLVVVVCLHLLRVFFSGACFKPRRSSWYIGLTLLFLVLAANFIGYLLPWISSHPY